jgi:hypothetical protein
MGSTENTGAPPLAALLMHSSLSATRTDPPHTAFTTPNSPNAGAADAAQMAPTGAARSPSSPEQQVEAGAAGLEPAIRVGPPPPPTRVEHEFFESLPSPALLRDSDEWDAPEPQRRAPSKVGKAIVGTALALGMGIVGFAGIRYAFMHDEEPLAAKPVPTISTIVERPIAADTPKRAVPAIAPSEIPPPDSIPTQAPPGSVSAIPSAFTAAPTGAAGKTFTTTARVEPVKPSSPAKDPFGTRLAPPVAKPGTASFGKFEPKPKAPAIVPPSPQTKPGKSGGGIVRDNPF